MKLELEGVSKSFGRNRVLNQVSETFEPGRIVAVLGLNGVGKSTLLQCMAGILHLNAGRILLDGEPFDRERVDQRRRFALLPDFPLLLPGMNALEQIGTVLRFYGKDTPGVEDRVLDLLRSFDLVPLAEMTLAKLSRGQAYKMALVGLIASDPELWLLDEPMAAGMDPLGLREFRLRARAATAAGATVIYTTQILSIAAQFSDEVLILNQGRVCARGPAAELSGPEEFEEILARLRDDA